MMEFGAGYCGAVEPGRAARLRNGDIFYSAVCRHNVTDNCRAFLTKPICHWWIRNRGAEVRLTAGRGLGKSGWPRGNTPKIPDDPRHFRRKSTHLKRLSTNQPGALKRRVIQIGAAARLEHGNVLHLSAERQAIRQERYGFFLWVKDAGREKPITTGRVRRGLCRRIGLRSRRRSRENCARCLRGLSRRRGPRERRYEHQRTKQALPGTGPRTHAEGRVTPTVSPCGRHAISLRVTPVQTVHDGDPW